MKLGNPLIEARKFEHGGYAGLGDDFMTPDNFDIFQDWLDMDDDTLADMLQYTFGLQNPGDYTDMFADYDPSKQNMLFDAMKQGISEASSKVGKGVGTAKREADKLFGKYGPDVGFGGVGKTLMEAMGNLFKERDVSRSESQQTFESGAFQEMQDWTEAFEQQVEDLSSAYGAQFCQEGKIWDPNAGDGGDCVEAGDFEGELPEWYDQETAGDCPLTADDCASIDKILNTENCMCVGDDDVTSGGTTCTDENACNTGADGDCEYPDPGFDCLGNSTEGDGDESGTSDYWGEPKLDSSADKGSAGTDCPSPYVREDCCVAAGGTWSNGNCII